jgi:potassium-dependent mechanosensitive channel
VLHQRFKSNSVIAFLCAFLSLCLLIGAGVACADSPDPVDSLTVYLEQEHAHLTRLINDAKAVSPSDIPYSQADLTQLKQRNARLLTVVRGKLASFNEFLSNQHKQQQQLTRQLKKIQQMPLNTLQMSPVSDDRMTQINRLKLKNTKTIQLINDNIALVTAYQELLLAEQQRLDLLQANWVERHAGNELSEKINALKQARDALYQKNIVLQQEENPHAEFSEQLNHEAQVLINNQAIILLQHQLTELQLEKHRIAADYSLLKNQDLKTMESVAGAYESALKQLHGIEQSLTGMLELFDNEQSIVSDAALKKTIKTLRHTAQLRLQKVIHQQEQLQKELHVKEEQLKQQLASRQSLAEYHLDSWPEITNQLLKIPTQLYQLTHLLWLKAKDNYLHRDSWSAVLVWVCLGSIIFLASALARVLHRFVQGKERSNMSGHLYDGVLVLLYCNMPHLTTLTLVMVFFFLNQVPFANYRLLINLFLVWLTFRTLILIARLMLLDRISDASGKDVTLYYRLKWLLLMGGWSTALMIFSHQFPLSLLLQDIFNRLFMLFLLAISWVAWKSKEVIPYLLLPLLRTKKRYLRHALSLLVVLIPLTLMTTAIIGLIGFIDLAWTMSRYQADVLLIMTSYVLVRGIILDGIDLASKWMIRSLSNGWLWIEVLLKPLDAIARVGLVLLAILGLFQLFGWYSDSQVVLNLHKMAQYPFVNLSGAHITMYSVLSFLALLFVFMWFVKWTREFCFRWLYRRVSDPGIRNSLSIFTQYAVILSGGLIALRVLGIDFSGMAIVFGGLAVGMGFGLRDFASNIVGGIILLIERPVREGDVITLGEYEGRVAHIGIRSMRVSSWDNMEVLIPNAETFNKPFTNWTLQDNIVRTVVPIKVNRADDPTVIQQLIYDVLVIIPEVLDTPSPQVFLKQIDDVLIDFEVRYFINVQHHTRFEVRSTVLFAIMAQFKATGVQAPTPSLHIDLNDATQKPNATSLPTDD